ncbi:GNAT family N-acetyltransferase [Cellulomonas sp. JH27-2]|uniref:GNAT family N-acetyltransferase n=1 Tax=Cellulomonas sp. JH27-2 TaxID=2774139 RepID=UPI00177FC4A4|nr:GNAT family N-acetyltransferase [Cellulomonas sp. JH27-2]MBD8059186.1 GNAT family N-acetyltransferase [Cellulomonas sp. JH27-2]
MPDDPTRVLTDRLDLRPPLETDLDGLFAVTSDPRLWQHFPTLRHTSPDQTVTRIREWGTSWREAGLGTWAVRERGDERIVGNGGCTLVRDTFWNLGYRLAVDVQGKGYATELSREAIRRANDLAPDVPVVAYLLEHNTASARVAERVGLTLVHRAPDSGNPDPGAVRLVFADRPLDEVQLEATLR